LAQAIFVARVLPSFVQHSPRGPTLGVIRMPAYRPGQGIAAGTTDKLRERKELSEICSVCGERVEEAGLGCASVDDSKQWSGLLGEGTGTRKKARCAECTKPLPEDHDPSLGPFCVACAPSLGQRKLAEDSRRSGYRAEEAPAAKGGAAPASSPAHDTSDVQFGHLVRPGVCNRCREERRTREREEAKAKKDLREQAKEQALEEGVAAAPVRAEVSLAARPFGMTPSKAEGAGYLVTKISDGKPAAQAGVRPGWRVAEVAGAPCSGQDMEAVQALLKAAELPVSIVFETVPNGADFCTACCKIMVWAKFSRKMRTKPPEKRRCEECVAAGGAE